jgi:iron-sulfur cluster repair protein YtfE (RIC family)
MAVLTGTLTINAAFLAEIKEDNRRLRELLDAAASDATFSSFGAIVPRERVELYRAVRDQLALHFTLEDAFGYFHDAIEDNPRLNSAAEKLHAQHESLFREMCRVVDASESILYSEQDAITVQTLMRNFIQFYNRLAEHEHSENELILSAFDDDIGVGD